MLGQLALGIVATIGILALYARRVSRALYCSITPSSLSGKVYMVTGANSGIGFETALRVSQLGATVILVCRDEATCRETEARIRAIVGHKRVSLVPLPLDLSDLDAVKRAAQKFVASRSRLDVLVNNAGVAGSKKVKTALGQDLVLSVNHLAVFSLTMHLLPALHESKGRVVTVASSEHARVKDIDFGDLNWDREPYNSRAQYQATKLMNIMFTYKLHAKYGADGVEACCLNPGLVKSSFFRNIENTSMGVMLFKYIIIPVIGRTPEAGAQTVLHCCWANDVSGKYFNNCAPIKSSPLSYDVNKQEKLWEATEKLLLGGEAGN